MRLVTIEELKKNDVVLVEQGRPSASGGTRVSRTLALVSEPAADSRAHFWSAWSARYYKGKLLCTESIVNLILPLDTPGTETRFYRIGTWNPKTGRVESV